MPEPPDRRYTDAEMSEILRRALARQQPSDGGATHDELMAAAREVGIDTASVEAAALEVASEKAARTQQDARARTLRRGFYGHLTSFVIINAFFAGLSALFASWTALAVLMLLWGMGLVMHGVQAFFPRPETPEQRARREFGEARRAERERRRTEKFARRKAQLEARAQLQRSAEDFERAVQSGVSSLLDSLARRADKHLGSGTANAREPGVRVDLPPSERSTGSHDDHESVARDADGLHASSRSRRTS